MQIDIDRQSGFCFGVVKAIDQAEKQLNPQSNHALFCLGDIVHNQTEVDRLKQAGLIVVNQQDIKNMYNTRLLIRAHGEPPETYEICKKNHIQVIDATCPVVLNLQKKIRKFHQHQQNNAQILIFGKKGHAEVNGLIGQTGGEAIVIESDFRNLEKVDFSKPVKLFSQTTQSKSKYQLLQQTIKEKIREEYPENLANFEVFQTICGQVSNRGSEMAKFAADHEVVIFVSDRKSSNGKYLFEICSKYNPRTHFVSKPGDVQTSWFAGAKNAGVCGATSTPMWLMEKIAQKIEKLQC
ncbi:MAG: 4-hydroxy-3-methylbut-2-enyl diphosphate reductase [Bacteroidales bacterium]